MKKTLIALLIGSVTYINTASACSEITHSFDSLGTYSARSMDFCSQLPTTLVAYPRGTQQKSNNTGNQALNWSAKYGYVTVNQPSINKDFAADGVNEKGLAIHLLYMGETKQPALTNDKPIMDSYQWVHYVLGNYSNVTEVLNNINNYQIHTFPIQFGKEDVVLPIHFAIEDKSGNSAVIEFVNNKLSIHQQKNSVMTNEPNYNAQLSNLTKAKQSTQYSIEQLPGGADSANRFVRMSYINENMPTTNNSSNAVSYMFSAINSVTVPYFANYQQACTRLNDPAAGASDAWPTLWTTVTDLQQPTLYINNTMVGNRVSVKLSEVNLNKGQAIKEFDTAQTNVNGDVSKLLTNQKS
jgi:choloylglycine hydrolase